MDKPLILAVETSGRMGSLAVGIGDEILAEASFSGPMRHSAELFPGIQSLLSQIGKNAEQIEHIYFTAGPGSFTGLRIAVTMAKMMAFANGVKIVAVDTMDVIAENASRYISEKSVEISRIAPILDAKRKQFYFAVFEWSYNKFVKISNDGLIMATDFVEQFGSNQEKPLWLLGEGLVYYKDKFHSDGLRILSEDYWSAQAGCVYSLGRKMAKAGKFTDPVGLVPFYIRRPEAVENREKRLNTT